MVSRSSIKCCRGAFVKVLKMETQKHARRCVAAERARAQAEHHEFHFVVLMHSQDAADLRLRSRSDYTLRLPARSRASNVLGQVVTLYVRDLRISLPIELVALASKDAETLATVLEKTLCDISDNAGFAPASGGAP